MKFEKWTLGLAAVGAISLASVAQAEEMNAVQTALSGTTISGYVDTSAHWNWGRGTLVPNIKFNDGKADGFNLNVVQLSVAKPLDETDWAAGYKVDLWMGPDAQVLNTGSRWGTWQDFAIRQAYVALRVPFQNGIDLKMGVFDTIIGYESLESGNNPNYTRSYGHSIEPQTHTGLLATYRLNDYICASAGVANTIDPMINGRSGKSESYKAYMGSIALTAPEEWGWIEGSTLYGGVVKGTEEGDNETITSWYTGLTLATPVTGLKLGAAYDYRHANDGPDAWTAALYASYQATEKLSLHARGEYLRDKTDNWAWLDGTEAGQIWAATLTAQYDLWQNVISRAEFRWDNSDATMFGRAPTGNRHNAYMLAANVIYKF
ncbi:MAG: outer membrane beta-barrel protein [Verrucomicrobiales bacterium]|nr:outer membrane beta-barrel protein [Verrucomicrobiales bacterium]